MPVKDRFGEFQKASKYLKVTIECEIYISTKFCKRDISDDIL